MTTAEFNLLLQNLKEESNFETFYCECLPQIIKFSNYIFCGKNLGRDIAQDIFNYLLSQTSIPYVRHPRAWLFALCKNTGLKYLNNDELLEEDAPYVSFVEEYDCGELDVLLSGLSSKEREIIELKYISGFSLKEVAIIKNRTYAAVLKQHNRILKKLKKNCLKNHKFPLL